MIDFVHTQPWGKLISRYIKSEMASKAIRYKDLRDKLAIIGTHQTEGNLRQKINRGQLSAQLFLQLLMVMEIETLEISQLKKILRHLSRDNC